MSVFKFRLLGLNANLSQLLAVLMTLAWANWHMRGGTDTRTNRNLITSAVILYAATNLFSSALFAPDKVWSIRGAADVSTFVLIYLIARRFVVKLNAFDNAFYLLKLFNFVSVAFGLFSLLYFWLLGGRSFIGVVTGQFESGFPSIRALSFEPNFFAQITAVVSCFYLADIMLRRSKRSAKLVFFCFLTPAIIFSYTRGVYVALLAAIAAMVLVNVRKAKYLLRRLAPPVVVILVTLALFSAVSSTFYRDVFGAVLQRIANITDFRQGSGAIRYALYVIGLMGFLSGPLFGHGTLSADTVTINRITGQLGYISGTRGWLTGAWIQALNDTGIVGFLSMLFLFAAPLFENFRVFKQTSNDRNLRSIALGFLGGNIVLLVACQISSSLWFSFPWIYWGINAAFIHLVTNGEYDAKRAVKKEHHNHHNGEYSKQPLRIQKA
ncbi:MAG: O-antigen ligase family protein [Nitrososphaerota archaeon]|nr:O-antigen ligase family protein [Nitrososphaerota archaeon]